MNVSSVLGCLIILLVVSIFFIVLPAWHKKRAAADKREFLFAFGEFSADIDIPTIRSIVQLRVDSTLMRLAHVIIETCGDELMEASLTFDHSRRLAKRCGFTVRKTYQDYL